MTEATNETQDQAPPAPKPTIKGYRELSAREIDTMNSIKQLEGLIVDGCGAVAQLIVQCAEGDQDALQEASRWLSIGQAHVQMGMMAINRAIARPEIVR